MTYLPDTNVCIAYMRNKNAHIVHQFQTLPAENIVPCDIVRAELWYGVHRSGSFEANRAILEDFLAPFAALPFDNRAAEESGRVRRLLEVAGTPIGPYDLLIPSIAIETI